MSNLDTRNNYRAENQNAHTEIRKKKKKKKKKEMKPSGSPTFLLWNSTDGLEVVAPSAIGRRPPRLHGKTPEVETLPRHHLVQKIPSDSPMRTGLGLKWPEHHSHLRHHAHKDTTSLEPQFRSTKDSYVSTASRSDARGRKEPIELILSFHVLYLLVITRSFFILVLVGCF
ncbi:hypothetical protein BHM03_00045537 [Ensete ventricosum]|nr:hypothetical protein BHM03_00045537 [Ensete ventricosum]